MIILLETYSNLVPGLLMRLIRSELSSGFSSITALAVTSCNHIPIQNLQGRAWQDPMFTRVFCPVISIVYKSHRCIRELTNILQSERVILTSLGLQKYYGKFPKHSRIYSTDNV